MEENYVLVQEIIQLGIQLTINQKNYTKIEFYPRINSLSVNVEIVERESTNYLELEKSWRINVKNKSALERVLGELRNLIIIKDDFLE